jgi:hypothetical protein
MYRAHKKILTAQTAVMLVINRVYWRRTGALWHHDAVFRTLRGSYVYAGTEHVSTTSFSIYDIILSQGR